MPDDLAIAMVACVVGALLVTLTYAVFGFFRRRS